MTINFVPFRQRRQISHPCAQGHYTSFFFCLCIISSNIDIFFLLHVNADLMLKHKNGCPGCCHDPGPMCLVLHARTDSYFPCCMFVFLVYAIHERNLQLGLRCNFVFFHCTDIDILSQSRTTWQFMMFNSARM